MLVKLFGSVMPERAEHFSNANIPIDVTPLGSVMLERLVQPANVLLPIEVRPFGSVMPERLLHPLLLYLSPLLGHNMPKCLRTYFVDFVH